LLIDNITTSRTVEYENKGEYDEIEYYNLGFQVENIGKAIEKYFKLIITIDFEGYKFRYNAFDDSKPNHFIKSDNKKAISFSNNSPIFPGEIMTIGNIELGFPSSRKKEILENGKLNLELIYTNGTDEMEFGVKEIIKAST